MTSSIEWRGAQHADGRDGGEAAQGTALSPSSEEAGVELSNQPTDAGALGGCWADAGSDRTVVKPK